MIWNTLTREEKRKFNDLLAESGYKYDYELGMPVPLALWGTRAINDGYQTLSKPGRSLKHFTSKGKTKHFA